jgi:DNA polymerase-1
MGRRRYLPDITSGNNTVRAAAERMAINAPMQGTAADIIKVAMVKHPPRRMQAEAWMNGASCCCRCMMNWSSMPSATRRTELMALVKELMEGAMDLAVPLVVDMRVGKNWLEAH